MILSQSVLELRVFFLLFNSNFVSTSSQLVVPLYSKDQIRCSLEYIFDFIRHVTVTLEVSVAVVQMFVTLYMS
jgi:hypothetical protein